MSGPDTINGAFEALAAVATWRNVLQLWRDKQVRGSYWPAWAFFTLWGVWNLFYYPFLGQWASFAGGVLLVTGNAVWTSLAVLYRRR